MLFPLPLQTLVLLTIWTPTIRLLTYTACVVLTYTIPWCMPCIPWYRHRCTLCCRHRFIFSILTLGVLHICVHGRRKEKFALYIKTSWYTLCSLGTAWWGYITKSNESILYKVYIVWKLVSVWQYLMKTRYNLRYIWYHCVYMVLSCIRWRYLI